MCGSIGCHRGECTWVPYTLISCLLAQMGSVDIFLFPPASLYPRHRVLLYQYRLWLASTLIPSRPDCWPLYSALMGYTWWKSWRNFLPSADIFHDKHAKLDPWTHTIPSFDWWWEGNLQILWWLWCQPRIAVAVLWIEPRILLGCSCDGVSIGRQIHRLPPGVTLWWALFHFLRHRQTYQRTWSKVSWQSH